ncbi:hypothetical protein FRC07_009452, partial [Ceratobasidium sp. 392]
MSAPATTTDSDQPEWRIRAQAKKQQQIESIPPEWIINIPEGRQNVTKIPHECGVLSTFEIEVTDTVDVETILEKLRNGVWKSVDVTRAFYKRAIIAHQATNCLTEIFVERALARAVEMDKYLEENKEPKGPLHGLPISLKDQFTMERLETINGYVANIGDFATENAVLVDILYELGAVSFVRTNVPQTLMWPETYNNVFGRTLNPYNLSLTYPFAFQLPCAEYTLSGHPIVAFRTMEHGTLSKGKKAMIDDRPWLRDPMCVCKVWDEEAYQLVEHGGRGGRKCFGLIYDDGLVKPNPPVFRAMDIMRKALEAAGHEVIEWENRRHKDIFVNLADGGEDFRRECGRSGEPCIQTMDPSLYSHELHDPEKDKNIDIIEPLSVYELWEVHKQKRELRKKYLDHWQSTISRTTTGRPIDAIISPAAPFAATPHGKNTSTFYTSIWNALDYTVGVLPVTFIDPELDKPVPPHKFYSDNDKNIYHRYKPEVFKDAPVGLQVVGQKLEEEAVL